MVRPTSTNGADDDQRDVVTHEMRFAEEIFDRVAMFDLCVAHLAPATS